ncbi:DUF2515 family protein [Metabacillus schmidteae]|uniref:DUF2515 family protein n=1 Tax=Metabacillus schmidteae TaxID=2730405 RepID=UPI00158D5080|nr:DUF2515 family protein [Metabacillus schmidteae]
MKDEMTIKLDQVLKTVLTNKTPIIITKKEKEFISKIKYKTELLNKNNITRTKAYLSFYLEFPEIHWAFLAHMVSRNGGYNMTDLKSSLLSPFLTPNQQVTLFHFLERANSLIFHDAYPQLLLYKKSKEENTSYFHLLPVFSVSTFMIPIWEYFLQNKLDPILLTYALITNEQHYVENHLMSLNETKQSILHTFMYLIQETLGFTHVIFPYKRYLFLRKYSLSGIEVHNFQSVQTRINIGKKLYQILFSKHSYSSTFDFAKNQVHSGSRSDYWPHEYTTRQNKSKIFSPTLCLVWENVKHHYPKNKDWYTNFSQIQSWKDEDKVDFKDITRDVKRDLKLLKSLGKVPNLMK